MRRRWTRAPRLRWILPALVLIAVPTIALAQSQALGGKFRSGDEVVILSGETVAGDLYVSAGTVRIEGTLEGDLVAFGGQVDVTGEVGGDVIVGSGTLDIDGTVGGDVRAGAGQVQVDGSIGEDLLSGAGQVTIASSGTVGEDFVFGAGQVTLDGRVEGDVLGSAGDYTRRGSVGGTEDVTIVQGREGVAPPFGERLTDAVERFVSLLVVAALLMWLAPWSVEGAGRTVRSRPWPSIAWGILGLVLAVVAFVLIVVVAVFVGILLGLLGLSELVGLLAFAATTAAILLGFLLLIALGYAAQAAVGMMLAGLAVEPTSRARRWGALVLGVLGVVIVTSIPVVGGWIGFVIALFGFGGLLLTLRARRRLPVTPASAAADVPPAPPTPV